MDNPLKKIFKLIIAIGIPLLAGVVGSVFTMSAISTWYAEIIKPAWNPPNWIFGPVWTMLYVLMGIAAFLVWKAGSEKGEARRGLLVFCIQLALNALWSFIFFGLQSPGVAFAEIIILWLAILWTIIAFYKVSRQAAYLLLPYILWVSFAMYLNYAIWILN